MSVQGCVRYSKGEHDFQNLCGPEQIYYSFQLCLSLQTFKLKEQHLSLICAPHPTHNLQHGTPHRIVETCLSVQTFLLATRCYWNNVPLCSNHA